MNPRNADPRSRNDRKALKCLPSAALTAFVLSACGESAQHEVEIPLRVAGTDAGSFETNRGVVVELTRAELAFGPLYICSGAQAGELCETARLEWLDSAVVNLLDANAVEVGSLRGVSGAVRSYMYELGFSSVLTAEEPLVLDAARQLGGVSLRLEGRFTAGVEAHAFEARVAIRQGADAERGIPLVRKSSSEEFEHDVSGLERSLRVEFDVRAWASAVDFEALLASLCPEATAACPEPLLLDETTAAQRSLIIALSAGARPTFNWEEQP